MTKRIVVIGAGVAGLTSALVLARNGYDVTVIAKFMPGDFDIEYTSPWAGANWMSFVKDDPVLASYDAVTYKVFKNLLKEHPEAGIWHRKCIVYTRSKDLQKDNALLGDIIKPRPWFADVVDNFQQIEKSELPDGMALGTRFDSFCLNVQIYLPWLQSQGIAAGIKFNTVSIGHINEAFALHASGLPAELVVNCTGLFASKLGGVEDKDLYPARGQTVLVRNTVSHMYTVSGSDDGSDEITYIMSRPGGGTILGGSYQAGNWSGIVDPNLAQRIISRCTALCPELVQNGPVDIIRHGVGLRPSRRGGPRVEFETIDGVGKVVHNYGAGGAGYQSSYGMADAVVKLVDLAFAK
ncbi:hypothetical protein V1514DRAFT_310452 [Lipomyces japonicus]|uniref:uncharacterized protein n=1 Tax=Lipomyces japonicus TaxID=56871 RepID=UPI0034CE7873